MWLIFLFTHSSTAFAQNEMHELVKSKDYASAKLLLENQLEHSKQLPVDLFNLCLVEYHLNQPTIAVARCRQAIHLNPWLSNARQALDFISKKAQIREPLGTQGILGRLMQLSIWQLPSWIFHCLTLVSLFFCIHTVMQYFAYRKRALFIETTPDAPSLKFYFAILFLAFFAASAGFSTWMSSKDFATVIPQKTALQAMPKEDSLQLYDIFGGAEVEILRTQDGWAQVSSLGGGQITGWLPESSIIPTRIHN